MPSPNKQKSIKAARELLKSYGSHRPPVPVERIAKQLGAQVRYSPLDNELSGMIYIKDGVPIIGVNAVHPPTRQRFSLAHEIAHLQLHKAIIAREVHVDKGAPFLLRSALSAAGIDPMEIEANTFAAELLMPTAWLQEALSTKYFDINEDEAISALAHVFRVSTQAMGLRLGNSKFV